MHLWNLYHSKHILFVAAEGNRQTTQHCTLFVCSDPHRPQLRAARETQNRADTRVLQRYREARVHRVAKSGLACAIAVASLSSSLGSRRVACPGKLRVTGLEGSPHPDVGPMARGTFPADDTVRGSCRSL